jgi:hypothetical protein
MDGKSYIPLEDLLKFVANSIEYPERSTQEPGGVVPIRLFDQGWKVQIKHLISLLGTNYPDFPRSVQAATAGETIFNWVQTKLNPTISLRTYDQETLDQFRYLLGLLRTTYSDFPKGLEPSTVGSVIFDWFCNKLQGK